MSNTSHLSEDELIAHHYRDNEQRSPAAAHLLACPECRRSYDELKEMLGMVDDLPVPERPDDYGTQVWEQLEPQLRFRPVSRTAPAVSVWRLRTAVAVAMVLMLVSAFLAGRHWQVPGPEAPRPISESARERILLVAVGNHLERSRMMLVELVNLNGSPETDDSTLFDISAGRQRAEDLVAAGRIYRGSAADTGDPALAWVLEELERTLLEIAHSPEEVTHVELERIQKRVQDQGILFKVRVIGEQVDEQVKERPGRT